MTSQVVVDSGIFLATVLAETYSSQAKALVKHWEAQTMNLAAPTLFQYEIVALNKDLPYIKWLGNFTP